MLDHEYDGIRELDNRLPPWWLYGFYVTILIGVIYIWRYHIAETAPLSKQEFEIEILSITGNIIYQQEYKNCNEDFIKQIMWISY